MNLITYTKISSGNGFIAPKLLLSFMSVNVTISYADRPPDHKKPATNEIHSSIVKLKVAFFIVIKLILRIKCVNSNYFK